VTAIEDEFGVHVKKYLKRREVLVLVVCFITFCLSMPNLCPVSYSIYLIFLNHLTCNLSCDRLNRAEFFISQ
jgi:hypothetical protein